MERSYDLRQAQAVMSKYKIFDKYYVIYAEKEIWVCEPFEYVKSPYNNCVLCIVLKDKKVGYMSFETTDEGESIMGTVKNLQELTSIMQELKGTITKE